MPFTAIDHHGEIIVSIDKTTEQWDELRRQNRAYPLTLTCGYHLVLTSRGQTQYFAHASEIDKERCLENHEPESAEHMWIKARIHSILKDAGWRSFVEYAAPDRSWIADVLAVSPDGQRKIALEVQWSQQPDHRYRERQARYESAGIECHWFARHSSAARSKTFPVSVLKQYKGDWKSVDGDSALPPLHNVFFIDDVIDVLTSDRFGALRWVPSSSGQFEARGVTEIRWDFEVQIFPTAGSIICNAAGCGNSRAMTTSELQRVELPAIPISDSSGLFWSVLESTMPGHWCTGVYIDADEYDEFDDEGY